MWKPRIAAVQPAPASSFDRQLKLDGARVVALGDCAVCHTAKGGKPFAGGLPLATPFGTIYATNITSDPGIGAWSLDAFTRALRRGISRDGHQLYPTFPYIHFTRMSDHEVSAAYAYLMSRDPVKATTPDNKLIFPLNFRPLVAFWKVMFLRPGERAADPAQSVEWNRGRLLVDDLGHCAACHSPLNMIGDEKSRRAFDGGLLDGWDAPPLNQLSNAVKPWTKEQLVTYLCTGRASEHGAAASPMLPVTRDLATVPQEDVEAIGTYILSLQHATSPVMEATAATATPDATTASAQRGAILFNGSCASCHGSGSPMQTIGTRPTLAFSTAVNAQTPRNTIQIMIGGAWHGEDTMNYMSPSAMYSVTTSLPILRPTCAPPIQSVLSGRPSTKA
ncbi:MAG: Putative diheme cytochrome c-553 [uncultured Caballeronia sp.]|nr:MAG: Putative diheme cytochrome c-553 [uncultured Caballeronia sp.]